MDAVAAAVWASLGSLALVLGGVLWVFGGTTPREPAR